MAAELGETRTTCPYCGEPLTLLVDPEEGGDGYWEDCQVCCRPMLVQVVDGTGGSPQVLLRRDDE